MVTKLLVECRRRCCICHKFCGSKIKIHHIAGVSDNSARNAIALCFDCHAEVGHYVSSHPKGKKYSAKELRMHKEQWIETCKSAGYFIASTPSQYSPGPLEGLLNELSFNHRLWSVPAQEKIGCLFEVGHFDQCMLNGSLSLLSNTILDDLFIAYQIMKEVNLYLESRIIHRLGSESEVTASNRAWNKIINERDNLNRLRDDVINFLSNDSNQSCESVT